MTNKEFYKIAKHLERGLLPCPFCGGKANMLAHEDDNTFRIICELCYNGTLHKSLNLDNIDILIEKWNSRINNEKGE